MTKAMAVVRYKLACTVKKMQLTYNMPLMYNSNGC